MVKAAKVEKIATYFEGVGRRKTAIARVRFSESKSAAGQFTVNNRVLPKYFPLEKYQELVKSPLTKVKITHFIVSALVSGGGVNAQAEAVRLGLARALLVFNKELRGELKRLGFLRRDPRMVERKKFGSRKARRPQQWRKR